MSRVDSNFKHNVYQTVSSIPKGRLMTYGQIAAHCGAAWAAWEVGQIAHLGPDNLPWHRVVNKNGGLASGYTKGGRSGQKVALEGEGIVVTDDFKVNLGVLIWSPGQK